MRKRIFAYNMIRGIINFIIQWCNDAGIAISLEKREIEAIGALHGMTPSEVLDKIIRELEMAPYNDFGDTLTGQWEETTDCYILHAKPDDEDEDD